MKRISHLLRLKSRPLQIFVREADVAAFCDASQGGCAVIYDSTVAPSTEKIRIDFTIASTDPMTRQRTITSLRVSFQFPFRDPRMAVC
jgi:hypothetical protein